MDLFENAAIAKARKDVKDKRAEGCNCPVCDQFVKSYMRTITSTMARQLISAFHQHGLHWFHTRDIVLEKSCGAGDFSKLENWSLIERRDHESGEDGKKSSGIWRITAAGYKFIVEGSKVQKHACIYNGTVLGFDGGEIDIIDALGEKFDYNVLMGRR